jgi:hypothetical protein
MSFFITGKLFSSLLFNVLRLGPSLVNERHWMGKLLDDAGFVGGRDHDEFFLSSSPRVSSALRRAGRDSGGFC